MSGARLPERMTAAEFRQTGKRRPPNHIQALGRLPKGQMNKTEARFAAEILDVDADVVWYDFEAVKLMLAPNTSITIDFFLMRTSGLIEAIDVKGARPMITDDGWAKLKIAAARFPFLFKVAIPRRKNDGGGWDIEVVGR